MASGQEHAKVVLDALTTKNFGTDKMAEVVEAFAGLYAPDRDVAKWDDEARAGIFINQLRAHIVEVVKSYRVTKARDTAAEAEAGLVDQDYGEDVIGEPVVVTPIPVKPGEEIGPGVPGVPVIPLGRTR